MGNQSKKKKSKTSGGLGGKEKAKEEKRRKQEEKAKKSLKKKSKKKQGEEALDDVDDLEALLKEIQENDAGNVEVIVEDNVFQPSERSHFTLSPISGTDEVLMFGGEYFDGHQSICYNEVYRYHLVKNEWKKISSPNTPPPRCSHQACTVREHVYVFGGEFSTAWQFHHYRDLWRFNVNSNGWEQLEKKNGPSPRSGHRMILWKHYLVVFGGFLETAHGMKFYDDLYFFDIREEKWHKARFANTSQQPSPRSGCQFVLHTSKNVIYLYGGYAKVSVSSTKHKGRNLDDMWALHLTPPSQAGQSPSARWELVSKRGSNPSRRSGASSIVHKNRMLLFGGVTDSETENDVEGLFHNSLFAFDMDRQRWYELQVRKRKQKEKKAKKRSKDKDGSMTDASGLEIASEEDEYDYCNEDEEDDDGEDYDDAIDDNAFYVYVDGKLVKVELDDDDDEQVIGEDQSHGGGGGGLDLENPEVSKQMEKAQFEVKSEQQNDPKQDQSMTEPTQPEEEQNANPDVHVDTNLPNLSTGTEISKDENKPEQEAPENEEPGPIGRIAAGLALSGSKLVVIGGSCEFGDTRVTFDDIWHLDLNQMETWDCIVKGQWEENTLIVNDDETEEESTGDSALGDEDEAEEEDDGENEEALAEFQSMMEEIKGLRKKLEEYSEEEIPRSKESLREFFKRTQEYWVRLAMEKAHRENPEFRIQGKELRRAGFQLTRSRFDELRPTMRRLDELEDERQLEEQIATKRAKLDKLRAAGALKPKSKLANTSE